MNGWQEEGSWNRLGCGSRDQRLKFRREAEGAVFYPLEMKNDHRDGLLPEKKTVCDYGDVGNDKLPRGDKRHEAERGMWLSYCIRSR